MKRTLFLLYILALVTLNAVAQSFTLQGRVTDEQSEPLEFATVREPGQDCHDIAQGRVLVTAPQRRLGGDTLLHGGLQDKDKGAAQAARQADASGRDVQRQHAIGGHGDRDETPDRTDTGA